MLSGPSSLHPAGGVSVIVYNPGVTPLNVTGLVLVTTPSTTVNTISCPVGPGYDGPITFIVNDASYESHGPITAVMSNNFSTCRSDERRVGKECSTFGPQ